MTQNNNKLVAHQEEWERVTKELESENFKLMSYDNTLISLFRNVHGKNVLDYGAGPGVLALAVAKLGGKIKVYDLNQEMRAKAGEKIGMENVYEAVEKIPDGAFDIIICNLVLCIVPEAEVYNIVQNIKQKLHPDGRVYVGFCNPRIFEVKESNLDFRFPTGESYETNHDYKKIKKEGNYEIIESHRPIEWYDRVYEKYGLELVAKHFTPEYELKGDYIKDFIIFELKHYT